MIASETVRAAASHLQAGEPEGPPAYLFVLMGAGFLASLVVTFFLIRTSTDLSLLTAFVKR